MSAEETAGTGGANPVHQGSTPPLLRRKSVLVGMLTSGFVVANAATSSTPAVAATASTRSDCIWLDDMIGVSDDAKLTAALSIAAAASYPPTIRLTNRYHQFAQGNRTLFKKMTIWGPEGYNNAEIGGGVGNGCQLKLTMAGGWFVNSSGSNTFGVSMGNLAFVGGSGASVITQSGAGSLYCLYLHNISSSSLKSVLGTRAAKLLITAASFDGGAWEINNCYDGAFHLGGSDNTLWPNGCLLDSGSAFNTAGGSSGQYHLWCDYLDKTYIGPMYITCEGGWGGIKVTGPAYNTGAGNAGVVNIHGARIEGRNPAQPCAGANIRVEGGQLTLSDCWVAYGMANPALMGHTTTDAGVIHQTAGRLLMRGGVYDHFSGQAETVPFIYTAGGSTRVRDLSVGSRGGTWTGLPRVKAGAGTVNVDDTATKI